MRKLFFTLLIPLYLASCSKPPPKSDVQAVSVSTFTVAPQTIPATFEFVGVARSSHLVEIRARVEGFLNEIAYNEGSMVKKGDVLFRIDPLPFQAALDEARGELAEAQAVLWSAKRQVERLKTLYAENAVSRRDLDVGLSEELQAQAKVSSASANVDSAEIKLGYTVITSPLTGLAGASKLRAGSLITPSSNGLLTTITVVDPIWIYFSISDNELLKIQSESEKKRLTVPDADHFEVCLTLANGKDYDYIGKVKFTSPSLDQQTGSLMMRATFPNPNNEIRPGQFARAKVIGAVRPCSIFVPQRAVQQGSQQMFVYVVKDGKAVRKVVEPGEWYNDYWIINSGLCPGDEVIVDGVAKIANEWPVIVEKCLNPPAPMYEEKCSLTCEGST